MEHAEEYVYTVGKGVLRRLVHYASPHKNVVAGAMGILVLATVTDVLGPILMKTFIDKYLAVQSFPPTDIILLAVSYLVLQWITATGNYTQMILFQRVSQHVIQTLRVQVFSKVQRLSVSFFDRTPAGSLISRITNDTQAIEDLFTSALAPFLQNGILTIGILISMFALSVQLALICLLLIPVFLFIMAMYRRLSFRVFHLARHRLSELNASLNESLQGMYLIQAMRQEARLIQQFSSVNNAYKQARVRNIKINSMMLRPLVDIIYYATLILVIAFFGFHSLTSVVDVGVIYAFVNYLERFFEPINTIMERLNILQQALVAADRVFRLLDETSLADVGKGGEHPRITRGDVVFENVSFSYDGVHPVLSKISFHVKPGQTVALVGHTGSGKSSIVNLLMRFYPYTSGQIRIDGVPLERYQDGELRSQLGLVLQDSTLFTGTIADNIRFGRNGVDDDKVQWAARFVQADPFIAQLPDSFQHRIKERGAAFSSGQRQLLSFARTIAGDPKVLILDEATASIDTETEEAIQTSLRRMRMGRTTIAIAHRLSTIQDADLILVLQHGEIVERGTHQELLNHGGLYHKMYLLQKGVGERA
ncbi:ABC transporter ATP-binding protein/permease [Alicyclobacillus fastidiosus]|uniref:ABC transporter ATP-binding protein/permease n=1 Tax=Alicyclobacillus fastidiosus TaxID=392011 RepID=A0ABY6ZFB2_9BACL|nr:ABC transporter ATP-binding protein [Alicyclobacillus fastidiosus]WAH41537.1 ABC transporter ATP-binding protein/permease [Alicyclobacillus fastidiosus]GMA63191.1 ABC transporter ATP-binding protein [Alicyclobacillus fastidiosus]